MYQTFRLDGIANNDVNDVVVCSCSFCSCWCSCSYLSKLVVEESFDNILAFVLVDVFMICSSCCLLICFDVFVFGFDMHWFLWLLFD